MIMRLYDHVSPINFAYKGEYTTEKIQSTPSLAPMLTEETILIDDGTGTVHDFRYLKDMKDAYGIEEEDPETALQLVIKAYLAPIKTPAQQLADQQQQIEEQAAAIEELITATIGAE